MSNLGRSLSLNTGSSLFGGGATSQPQQSGGLFGSTTPASQPAQSGGLFASTPASSQPAQSGGLFGSTPAVAAAQPQQSGGLFGATPALSASTGGLFKLGAPPATAAAAAQSSAPSTGGLFGGGLTPTPASQPAGGLFGAAPTTSKPGGLFSSTIAGSSASASGGLFANTTASSQPATGGMFNNAAKPAGGLFSSTANAAAPSGGLFSNTAASQPAAGGLFSGNKAAGSLFGNNATQPQQPVSTGGLFGALNNSVAQPALGQQPSTPAVKLDWSNVKPTTRFNELHQEVQDAIVFIDEVIQGAMKTSMQCSEALPALGQQIDSLPSDVEYIERRLETVEGALGRDAVAVGQNKEVIEKDSEDAVRLFRAVENLKLPNQFHYSTIGSSSQPSDPSSSTTTTDLLSYFSKRAEELEQQAITFRKHQQEVDQHLRTVEHSAVDGMQKLQRRGNDNAGVGDGLREIAGVMRTFEDAILRVAERIGEGRESVVDLELGGRRK